MFNSQGNKPTGTSSTGANDTSSVATISLDSTVMDSKFTVISYLYMSWLDDIRRHMERDGWILKKITSCLEYNFRFGFIEIY